MIKKIEVGERNYNIALLNDKQIRFQLVRKDGSTTSWSPVMDIKDLDSDMKTGLKIAKVIASDDTFIDALKKELDRGTYWEDAFMALEKKLGMQDIDKVTKAFKKKYGKRPDSYVTASTTLFPHLKLVHKEPLMEIYEGNAADYSKTLNVLREKGYERAGGGNWISHDSHVRLISNKGLKVEVRKATASLKRSDVKAIAKILENKGLKALAATLIEASEKVFQRKSDGKSMCSCCGTIIHKNKNEYVVTKDGTEFCYCSPKCFNDR